VRVNQEMELGKGEIKEEARVYIGKFGGPLEGCSRVTMSLY